MTAETLLVSLHIAAPELVLALGALALLMVGVFSGQRAFRNVTALSVVLMAIVGLLVIFSPAKGLAFGGAYIADGFAHFLKIVALIGSLGSIIMVASEARHFNLDKFEYPVLIVLATLGVMLMISANGLLSLYMALELQSLALYVIAAINRDSLRSSEAGLKYFVLGALSSGMLLYGMSLIYGFTGNIEFEKIAAVLATGKPGLGLIFGLVFVMAGMAFKISAVPFHMWTPDVYEGAPTPVAAFLSAAPKVGAMAILIRVVVEAFYPIAVEWRQIVVFIAIASTILGAFAAIGQNNIKRMMAYSSIANMGYALIGLASGTAYGVSGVLVYMLIYVVTSIGSFGVIMSMRSKDGTQLEKIEDLAGLSETNPYRATLLTLVMFSLAGVPPLAGFFGKYFVFLAAIEAKLYWLAVVGVVTSVIGTFYYLRVVRVMWFQPAKEEFADSSLLLRLVIAFTGTFGIAYAGLAGPVGRLAYSAAETLFN